MDRLNLQPNVPELVALKFPDGKLSEGRFGDQMFYSLVDGRGWYAELDVAAKITMMEIRARQPFFVCKRWSGKKGERPIIDVWLPQPGESPTPPPQPQRAVPPPPPPPMPTPVPATAAAATGIPETDLERQLRQSLAQQAQRPQPVQPGQPPVTASNGAHVNVVPPNGSAANGGYANGNGSNGNGNGIPKMPTSQPQVAPLVKVGYDQALRRLLRTVIIELKEAGEQWSDEARQDLVSTLLIQAARDGAITWAPLCRGDQ